MLVQAPNPKGIDKSLQQLQSKMYTHLTALWSLDALSPDYQCYDRCFRNQTKEGLVPEIYSTNGYKQVLFDDKHKVQSFFDIDSRINVNSDGSNNVEVYLIFMLNLEKLKGKGIRPDELVRQEIQTFLDNNYFGFILKSITLGLDNVFSEFNSTKIKYRDMQPLHCLKFTFDKTYSFKDHICE